MVAAFLAAHDDPLLVTRGDVERWVDGLLARGLAPATVRLQVAALKRFYAFLDDRELLPGRDPCARVKPPRRRRKPIEWLSPTEDAALYRACMTRQERIVHALLRYAGVRVSEACSILQGDVDLARGELRVRASKTDSGLRTVPVLPELAVELEAWQALLSERGLRDPRLPVLVTAHRTPMKTGFAWRLVKRCAARAGVKASPHTLRRTFGSDLINRGVRAETVARVLGHADVRTTLESYAELLDSTVRDEILRAAAS